MSAKKPPEEKIANISPFGLRMPLGLREKIEEAAEDSGRSMNAEIVLRLERSFDPANVDMSPDGLREFMMQLSETADRLDKISNAIVPLYWETLRRAEGDVPESENEDLGHHNTVAEIAEKTRMTPAEVRALINNGEIEAHKNLSGHWEISNRALQAFVNKRGIRLATTPRRDSKNS